MTEKTKGNKPKVLIIEDDKGTQLLYEKVFPKDWFSVSYAADGESGIRMYNENRPDLIILDMMLPILTGFVVLKTIRGNFKDSSTKIIISTSLSSKSDIIECSRLGIQGYIVKPFQFKELRKKFAAYSPLADLSELESQEEDDTAKGRNKKPLGTSSIIQCCTAMLDGDISPADASKKIMEIAKAERLDLPSMPDIILKIQEALADEDASIKDLGEIISNDQNISSKLIGVANSAFYGGSKKSNTIEEAILRVGLGEAKEIIFVLSNRGMYAMKDSRFENDLAQLSDHSIACGVASRIIAEQVKYDNPFFLFTLGVLHDLGKLVLIRIFSDSYKGEENIDVEAIHEIIFKLHTFIGAMIIKAMEFPSTFEEIALKHEKLSQDFERQEKELPIIVMGNLLANKFGYSMNKPDEIDIPDTKVYKHLHMNEDIVAKVEEGLKQYFEIMGSIK